MKKLLIVVVTAILMAAGVGASVAIGSPDTTTICHLKPGFQNGPGAEFIQMEVPNDALPAHLAHGDSLGACGGGTVTVTTPGETVTLPAVTVTTPAETVTVPGPTETVTNTVTVPAEPLVLTHYVNVPVLGATVTVPGPERVVTKVKTRIKTVVKYKTKTVVKRVVEKCKPSAKLCPPGFKFWNGRCAPIVRGSG